MKNIADSHYYYENNQAVQAWICTICHKKAYLCQCDTEPKIRTDTESKA